MPIEMLKKQIVPISAYTIIFTCLFISYPLHDSLPSDVDSWNYVAWFNYYYQFIITHIQGGHLGQSLYPAAYPALKGEPSFGMFLFWLPFRLSGIGEIWSYYCLIILICIINAYSAYTLAGFYYPTSSYPARLLSGLIFSSCGFIIANIDSPNTIFWGFGILSVYFFNLSLMRQEVQYLLISTLLILFQMFICVFDAVYAGIIIICILAYHIDDLKKLFLKSPKTFIACIILGMVIAGSYFGLLMHGTDRANSWYYSASLYVVDFVSFKWQDFIQVLPGSLYYHSGENLYWVFLYKSFFPGIFISTFAIWGAIINIKRQREFGLILFISFMIGSGTYITIGTHEILLPLGILMKVFHTYSFYRFPFRIFIVIALVLSLCCVLPIDYCLNKVRYKWLLTTMIVLIFFIENIPLHRKYYDSYRYFDEGAFLKSKFESQPISNFLFLPSGDFMLGHAREINKTEQIYMYWQTCIKKNVVNGYGAFFPMGRVEMNNAIQNFKTDKKGFIAYLHKYNIRHIVYYNNNWGLAECPADIEAVKKIASDQNIDFTAR